MDTLSNAVPALGAVSPEALKIILVLFLSFLIGLEREERGAALAHSSFGGVRTFPLIGLIGYAFALVSGTQVWAIGLGFLGVAGFLMLSYWHKMAAREAVGVTSEMSALATYLIGALVSQEQFWIATTLAVVGMILLELKTVLEGLAKRLSAGDIFAFTKFLLLTAVVLPIVPNANYTAFEINPYQTWLVVVAVSAISYGSYVLQKATRDRESLLLAAVLGGAYSSTVTTIALARRAVVDARSYLVSGAILTASGVMYLRLTVLLALFNGPLLRALGPWFVAIALVAILVGIVWSRREHAATDVVHEHPEPPNPLELGPALLFALLYVAMLVAGRLAAVHLGRSGVLTLATVMGVSDVDPFILSMARSGTTAAAGYAAPAIVIAAASNNIAKGVYAYLIAPRACGLRSLALLTALGIAGVLPLLLSRLS